MLKSDYSYKKKSEKYKVFLYVDKRVELRHRHVIVAVFYRLMDS